jgi:hypothetical protein
MSLQRKGFMHQGCIKNAAPLRGLRGTEPCQRTLGEWATDKTLPDLNKLEWGISVRVNGVAIDAVSYY